MTSSMATATTIRAPVDQTLAFVGYHLRSGIDHMFLYFDDPDDPTIPRLRETEHVTCIPCDEEHWKERDLSSDAPVQAKQMRNATEAFYRAREAGIEWLVHLDSDELLHGTIPLRQLFDTSPARADALVFPTKEAVPQQFHYERPFQDIELFKYDPSRHLLGGDVFHNNFEIRVRGLLARTWRYRRQFVERIGYAHPSLLGSFLLGHTNGKAATRTSVPVRKIGNHRPKTDGERRLRVYTLRRGAVLHFDCMGYDRWRQKWRRRLEGAAHFNTERFRPDRRRVLQMFETAAQAGEEALRTLYRRMYVVSPTQKILLRSLGLIERITLSEGAFTWYFLGTQRNDGP